MPKQRNVYHVTPSKQSGWAIRKEGRKRELSRFSTKEDAIKHAKQISKKEKSDYVVHRKDGSIQTVDAYEKRLWKPVPSFTLTNKTDFDDIRSVVRAVYVVPQEGEWVVTKGGEVISPSSDSVVEAINFAWDIRKERRTEIIVYDENGNAIRSSSYPSFESFRSASSRVDE